MKKNWNFSQIQTITMNNIRYLFTLPGMLKAVTVILGLMTSAIIGHAYDRSLYNNMYKTVLSLIQGVNVPSDGEGMGKEGYFLSISVMFFLLSLAFFVCHIMTEELNKSPGVQFFDAGYHALGAVLIFIGACLVMSSAVNINKLEKQLKSDPDWPKDTRLQYKSEKIVSGVFGLINGIIYGLTAWVTFIGNPQPEN